MAQRHKITQMRVAASLLKCGTNRIWMDPTQSAKIQAAITRMDVRRLINAGLIRKLPAKEKGAAGKRRYQRAGSRKGKVSSRMGGKKANWLKTVRAQRKLLNEMKPNLQSMAYRKTYRMIKGGAFRSRVHLTAHMESEGLIKKTKVKK